VLVGVDGTIRESMLLGGHPLLKAAAAEALKEYRYESTLVDGAAAEVLTQVDVKVPGTEAVKTK
jgi:hypothetical protein